MTLGNNVGFEYEDHAALILGRMLMTTQLNNFYEKMTVISADSTYQHLYNTNDGGLKTITVSNIRKWFTILEADLQHNVLGMVNRHIPLPITITGSEEHAATLQNVLKSIIKRSITAVSEPLFDALKKVEDIENIEGIESCIALPLDTLIAGVKTHLGMLLNATQDIKIEDIKLEDIENSNVWALNK